MNFNSAILKIIVLFFNALLLGLDVISAQGIKSVDTLESTNQSIQCNCTFYPTGRNVFFILEPGYQLILENKEEHSRLVITVLNETKVVSDIQTRVVEEYETLNDETVEISRNFYAFCKQTGSIYYFGEEVDIYKNGKIVGHDGSWIAEGKNKAGIIMPGIILPGDTFYQEFAPGVAMDKAEIISISETIKTHQGYFVDCLKTEETTRLKSNEKEYKYYAPGVGLIKEDEMLLVKHGFKK